MGRTVSSAAVTSTRARDRARRGSADAAVRSIRRNTPPVYGRPGPRPRGIALDRIPSVIVDTIPVFPLDHVLLPGLPLPLHIFEPRYRQMLADIEASRGGFGIVALSRGSETSADVDFAKIGTLAEILEKEPYPDGSCDLLTVGSRRFRIVDVDSSAKPYLQAQVEWLSEDDGDLPADLALMVTALFGRYSQVLSDVSDRDRDVELVGDPVRLSYEVAARVQLPVSQRQKLLAMPTAADRLLACLIVMRREITLIEQASSIPGACTVTGSLRVSPSAPVVLPPPVTRPTTSVSTAPSRPPAPRAAATAGPREARSSQLSKPVTSPTPAVSSRNRPSEATNDSFSTGTTV